MYKYPFLRFYFHFWVYNPKWSVMAGLYGKSPIKCLGQDHTISHSGFTMLHSHQRWIRVPGSPQPHQYLCFCFVRSDCEARTVHTFLLVVPMSKFYYSDTVKIMQLDHKGKTRRLGESMRMFPHALSLSWGAHRAPCSPSSNVCVMLLPREAH